MIEMQCPECRAPLRVSDDLAGKWGDCPQCNMPIPIPIRSQDPPPVSPPKLPPVRAQEPPKPVPPVPSAPIQLSQATPDDLVNEFSRRGKSAVFALFDTPVAGQYDLPTLAKAKVRLYSTFDMDDAKKLQALENLGRIAAEIGQARIETSPTQPAAAVFELKGDPLGMTLAEFKKKYARKTGGIGLPLPWCSSDSPGQAIEALLAEPWHAKCGIVHARIDLPAENKSPTVGGVKTDMLLYQFVDERLFRITAFFDTDSFHVVRTAVVEKHDQPSSESLDPMQFSWDNGVSSIHLVRGTVRPKKASRLHYVHNVLFDQMQQRTPKTSDDL